MKTKDHFGPDVSSKSHRVEIRPTAVGIWAVAMVVLSGCVADRPAGLIGRFPPLAEPLRMELGTIVVVAADKPGAFSFDAAQGQREHPGDRASDAAGSALIPPNLHDPLLEAAASPVMVAWAPFAALHGAMTAQKGVSPETLFQCESNLMRAMTEMSAQKHFRSSMLTVAKEKTRRRFVAAESWPRLAANEGGADAVLQTELQELRLERTGQGDSSFALRIKTRVRLMRAADGTVLFDQPAEFRSGPSLFLDWTRAHAVQQVAETAYRKLAEQVVDQLFAGTAEGPVLAGAGYKRTPLQERQRRAVLAGNDVSPTVPIAHLVKARTVAAPSIGISSSAGLASISVQRPQTRDEAVAAAVTDLTKDMDGLYNHPNLVVMLAANAVAIPLGLWKQGTAIVRGLSPAERDRAQARLDAAVRETQPAEAIAVAVAQQLFPHNSESQVLVKSHGAIPQREFSSTPRRVLGRPLGLAVHQPAAGDPIGDGASPLLDIHVVSTALRGESGVNPSLALCVEAEVRWRRTGDGREVYTCPIQYRSERRKFTAWAAHDAQLFREELQRCYQELGITVADQLRTRQLVTPPRLAQPALAGN